MKVYTPRGRVFVPGDLRTAYRQLDPQIVADLAELCFAGDTPFADTDRQTCLNLGRQQVWLHINRFLGLSQEQIEEIYVGRGFVLTNEEANG